ncbi:transposase [Saccharothrix sp. BKS2]|uniref:transposase n=1 Tax=Saccharothrix sp. BKS2 TaxID=3064400 RepID=UPI0039E92E24
MAAPSAAVVDSRSVGAAATVGRATRGWDGGKEVAGRRRHIVVDTPGLLVAVLVTPASAQDRSETVTDAAPEHMARRGRSRRPGRQDVRTS